MIINKTVFIKNNNNLIVITQVLNCINIIALV